MPSDVKRRWRILVEDAVILLSVLALWPTVLGWTGPVFRALQGVVLLCLLGVLAVRIKRIRGKGDD